MRELPGGSRCRALAGRAAMALGCVLVLLASARDAAADFTRVTANLASRSFDKTLPFDEEFKIVGTTTAPIKLMQVFYAQRSDSPPPCPYDGKKAEHWRGPYEYRNPAGSTSFEVHIENPLEAERTYTVLFCSTSTADPGIVKAFRTQALNALDREIGRMRVEKIEDSDARSLRNQLCAALRDNLESNQIVAPGTLFDCNNDNPRRLVEFRTGLSAILAPQIQLEPIFRADNYANRLGRLGPSLSALASDSALDALVAALRESGHAAADISTVADIAELTEAAAREMGEGRGPAVVVSAPGLAQTSSAIAADVARNFRETEARLRRLYRFLNDNLRDDGVTKKFLATLKTPLPDPTVNALQALAPNAPAAGFCPALALICAVDSVATLGSGLDMASTLLVNRGTALQQISEFIALEIVDVSVIRATTFDAVDTNKTNYVSADAGFLAMPRQREAAAYIATNIYFRPINPHAPLSQFGGIARRMALTVGLTLDSVADEAGTRFDLVGGKALVIGLGFRVTEVLRLSGGTVVFRKADENPFVNRKPYAFEPYVSFSLDLNVAVGAKGFGELFKPKNNAQPGG